MLFYQLCASVAALAACVTAALCLSNRPLTKVYAGLAYLCFCVALSSVPAVSQVFFKGRDTLLLWRLAIIGITAVAPVFYYLALNLSEVRRKYLRVFRGLIAAAILLAAMALSPLMVKSATAGGPVPGPAFILVILLFLAGSLAGLKLISDRYGWLEGYGKTAARYQFFSCAVLMAGILINFVFFYGVKAAALGNILAAGGIVAFYAFSKYSVDAVRLTITRVGIFTVIYAVVLGFPFWFGGATSRWKLSVALMGVLASLGPFVYNALGKKIKSVLLAQQRRYQQILLEISQSMVKEHDLNRLAKFIVYAVKMSVKMEFAALFLNSQDDKAYVLKAVKDPGRLHPKFFFSYKHPLVAYLKEHKRPVRFDELPSSLDGFKEVDLGIRLIVPSFSGERLICFLLLGEKLDKTAYSEDDINVFLTLSGQMALSFENCMFLNEFEKAQEKIFNADKLASLGGMADGVAHQIKNRLNQFSIAAGEQQYEIEEFMKKHGDILDSSQELKKTFEYLFEISSSMLDNVKKTSNVIQGVLSFARVEEKGTEFMEFDVRDIVKPTLELLCVKHQTNEFPLTDNIEPKQAVYGMKAQIMECLYNILDNSYEAIREKIDYHLKDKTGFTPEISIRIIKKDKASVIEVSDNGLGIKPENTNKIFAPFFTTKSSFKTGSGVGMYVVKRMIEENHKGRVIVESEYMKGTKVLIELPNFKAAPKDK